eukprot:1878036-Pyramimonas_sp.AAC.1
MDPPIPKQCLQCVVPISACTHRSPNNACSTCRRWPQSVLESMDSHSMRALIGSQIPRQCLQRVVPINACINNDNTTCPQVCTEIPSHLPDVALQLWLER